MEEERRAVSRLKAPVAARALVPENSLGPPALESGVLAPPLSELREMTQWAPCPGWKGVEWEAEGTSWVLALALPSLTIHQQVLLTARRASKLSPPHPGSAAISVSGDLESPLWWPPCFHSFHSSYPLFATKQKA